MAGLKPCSIQLSKSKVRRTALPLCSYLRTLPKAGAGLVRSPTAPSFTSVNGKRFYKLTHGGEFFCRPPEHRPAIRRADL